jgi:outer membrane lipoprotein-sorting protein
MKAFRLSFFVLFAFWTPAFASSQELKKFVLDSIKHNENLVRNFTCHFSYQWFDGQGNAIKPKEGETITTLDSYLFVSNKKEFYSEYETHRSDGSKYSGIIAYDGSATRRYRKDLNNGLITSQRHWPTVLTPDRFTNLYVDVKDLTMSEFLEASEIKTISSCKINQHDGYLVEVVHCDSSKEAPVEQKIYFDAEIGFIPVKTETYRLDISKEMPVLITEGVAYEKRADGVYFPTSAKALTYKRNSNGKMDLVTEVRVSIPEVKVNVDLPQDIFTLKFPQGAKVYDEIYDISYTVGEALDTINKIDEISNVNLPENYSITENVKDKSPNPAQIITADHNIEKAKNVSKTVKLAANENAISGTIYFIFIGLFVGFLCSFVVIKILSKKD